MRFSAASSGSGGSDVEALSAPFRNGGCGWANQKQSGWVPLPRKSWGLQLKANVVDTGFRCAKGLLGFAGCRGPER